MKYSKKFKLEAVLYKETTISEAAKKRKIPKQTLSRWVKLYKHYGKEGLENKKTGAKEKKIDPNVERRILSMWIKKKRSAYKMLRDLGRKFSHPFNGKNNNKEKNGSISKRDVYKIYKKYDLKHEKTGKYNLFCF